MNYNTETIGRRTRVLIIAMLTVLMMLGCVEGVSAASLNKKSLTGYVSGTYQLKVKGTDKKVTWSTSNKKIALVSSKGLVTAKKTGKATITAKVNGKSYACKVTVLAKPKISTTKKTIVVGNKFTLTLKKSNGAKIKATKFKSSKQSVATVTSKGVVAGRKQGTCKIYTYLGSIEYTTTVTVNKKGASSVGATTNGENGSVSSNTSTASGKVLVTELKIGQKYSDGDLSSMKPGEYIRLEVKSVLPSNAENKKVTWASNDEKVATVSTSGLVTAVAPGTTKIVARAADGSGVKDTVSVTVKDTENISSGQDTSNDKYTYRFSLVEPSVSEVGNYYNVYIFTDAGREHISCAHDEGLMVSKPQEVTDASGERYVFYSVLPMTEGSHYLKFMAESQEKSYEFTVRGTNQKYASFRTWANERKNELWKAGMTKAERLAVLCRWIGFNCSYANNDHGEISTYDIANGVGHCYSAASVMCYFAREMDLECCVIDFSEINKAFAPGSHFVCWVLIDGVEYYADATPSGGSYEGDFEIVPAEYRRL